MGVNWNRIIKDQSRGMDPVSAFNKEQNRMREENRKRFEEEKRRKSEERHHHPPDDLGDER